MEIVCLIILFCFVLYWLREFTEYLFNRKRYRNLRRDYYLRMLANKAYKAQSIDDLIAAHKSITSVINIDNTLLGICGHFQTFHISSMTKDEIIFKGHELSYWEVCGSPDDLREIQEQYRKFIISGVDILLRS